MIVSNCELSLFLFTLLVLFCSVHVDLVIHFSDKRMAFLRDSESVFVYIELSFEIQREMVSRGISLASSTIPRLFVSKASCPTPCIVVFLCV